jgi:hypothetical protein
VPGHRISRFLLIQQGDGVGDDLSLGECDDPVPQRGLGAGQLAVETVRHGDQVRGLAPGLGQHVRHLISAEVIMPGLGRAAGGRLAGRRAAAGQLGDRS